MVIACLALFVASTGTSIAASHYLITSTKQIKPSVIKKLKGANGPRGNTGAAGVDGVDGAAGATGAPGISNLVIVESAHYDVPPGFLSYAAPIAYCPAGTKVVGTGFYNSITDAGFVKAYGSIVGAIFWNNSSITVTGVYVQAICASVATTSASSVTASTTNSDRQRFEADLAKAKAAVKPDAR